MRQYIELLKNVVEVGYDTPLARDNMPATKMLPNQTMDFDLNDGIPLLTTKKVHLPSAINEMLWILKGGSNIKWLLDRGCNVWNQNAYKWYCERMGTCATLDPVDMGQFIKSVKAGYECVGRVDHMMYITKDEKVYEMHHEDFLSSGTRLVEDEAIAKTSIIGIDVTTDFTQLNLTEWYILGDLGKVYGPQLRKWNNEVDQFDELIKRLIKNPFGRYAKVVMWNPSDMPNLDVTSQPNCHGDFQVTCYPLNGRIYFELMMTQRSADLFLGVPFNLIHYTLLGKIIEELTGYIFTKFKWVGANTHVYNNHIDAALRQLDRTPYGECEMSHDMMINRPLKTIDDIADLELSDIQIIDNHGNDTYHNQGTIKAELCVGLNKNKK